MTIDFSNLKRAENDPRVAVLSLRDINDHVSSSCGYTFEDVIAKDLDDVEIFRPSSKGTQRPTQRAINRISRRTPFGKAIMAATTSEMLRRDYDLFFFYPVLPRDLNYLDSIKDWRQRSGVAVCWLQEIWVESISTQSKIIEKLNEFDHVICSFHHTVKPLQDKLNVPVTYMPWGVDTELFCPYPTEPNRVIDIANIGGVRAPNHESLIDYADQTGKFYSYSTIQGHHGMRSHVEHRKNYAGMLKRSKYLLSYIAKVARDVERGGQEEFGLRYIEGVAAGAILLGDTLPDPAFAQNLGWQDAVIEAPYDTVDIIDIIDSLENDPARVAEIQRRNVIEALSRHDHLYRWEKILDLAGLAPASKIANRRARLSNLVTLAKNNNIEQSAKRVPAA